MLDALHSCVGTVCEIKSMENELLFPAKVRKIVDSLSLSIDLVSTDGGPLPIWPYGVPVKLSFHPGAEGLFVLSGNIYMSNPEFWRISSLKELQTIERRNFFRVSAHSPAKVSLMPTANQEEEHPSYAAQLIDISLSGVKFSSLQQFNTAESLLLYSFLLGEDNMPFAFGCKIRRIEELHEGEFIYRCSFENAAARDSDRLCKAIFFLQREMIKRQRSRL